MINVAGLSKRYGTHLAVKDVNFNIEKGEVVGFLGPNGAGKSTIMNILTGYLSTTQGEVTIDGFNIVDYPEEAKRRIGYLPEIPPLYPDMKVREYLDFIYDLKKVKFPKKPHIDEILKLVKIDNVQNRLIKNLSKGYRQRVGFAGALIGNPDVLILDEPTVGLDPKQIIEIRNLIGRLGKNHTIILSSHILSEIQAVCKRVIIINRGEIIADDNSENLAQKLSDDSTLLARITGNETDMLSALKSIKNIKSVSSLGQMEIGSFDYIIEPEDGVDVRADIFDRVVSRGKKLLTLKDNKLSLEQIFLRLTEVENDKAKQLLKSDNGEITVVIEESEEE
ncbi:MAG: ATP-binding cassette domain-containing protein [Clostridia bacterium]|nr:ATP-binding cassette domain-containing protein [Clostridia bacterium]